MLAHKSKSFINCANSRCDKRGVNELPFNLERRKPASVIDKRLRLASQSACAPDGSTSAARNRPGVDVQVFAAPAVVVREMSSLPETPDG